MVVTGLGVVLALVLGVGPWVLARVWPVWDNSEEDRA